MSKKYSSLRRLLLDKHGTRNSRSTGSSSKRGVKEKLAEICKRNDIVFMAIFGSFARGEQRKTSDIDMAIEFDKNKEKIFLIWFTWKTS